MGDEDAYSPRVSVEMLVTERQIRDGPEELKSEARDQIGASFVLVHGICQL